IRVFNISFQPITWDWQPIVWALAAVSIVAGSLLAIAQTDIKRLLAYSSISQAGFVLLGLTAAGEDGIGAALFYLVAYAATVIGAFGVVMVVSARGERHTSLSAYAGLARRSPVAASESRNRVSSPAGFVAKVAVFRAATEAGYWFLVLIGVLASVVAAYAYLRVVVLMFMREPEEDTRPDESWLPRVALAVPAVLVVVFGVFPGLIVGFLERAAVLRW